MEDLFDRKENQAMLERIAALKPNAPAQWGKMNVAQMLAHAQVALEIALGTKTLKRGLIGFLFGGMAKKKLLAPAPFDRNLPTAPIFKVVDQRDFAVERGKLVALVRRFAEVGPAGLSDKPHPFFGPLTTAEWSALQWKHLDHHLRQFGA